MNKVRVFISYARADHVVAEQVAAFLATNGVEVHVDHEDVSLGDSWQDRLARLIAEAEKLVFLLSPHSAASPICAWEVENADTQGKPILPLRIAPVDTLPDWISRHHFIPYDETGAGHSELLSALFLDLEWEREKTRINNEANLWANSGRPNRLLLTRADEIRAAEYWRDSKPPTAQAASALQMEFIATSRRIASSRQSRSLVASVLVAALLSMLSVGMYIQWSKAKTANAAALEALETAESERVRADEEAARAQLAERAAEVEADKANAERDRAEEQRIEAIEEKERAEAETEAALNAVISSFGMLYELSIFAGQEWKAGRIQRSTYSQLLDQFENRFFEILHYQGSDKLKNTAHLGIAQALAAGRYRLGDKHASATVFGRYIADLERRYRADPTITETAETLAGGYLRLAGEYFGLERYGQAEQAARASVLLYERLIDQNAELSPGTVHEENARRAANLANAVAIIYELRRAANLPPPFEDFRKARDRLQTALDDERVVQQAALLDNVAAELMPFFERMLESQQR